MSSIRQPKCSALALLSTPICRAIALCGTPFAASAVTMFRWFSVGTWGVVSGIARSTRFAYIAAMIDWTAIRALTVRQPWAGLLAIGRKDIENRTWRTHYRGPLLIHAGVSIDFDAVARIRSNDPRLYITGGFIGLVEIVDCVTESRSPWFQGPHGFAVAGARFFPIVKARGGQRFFRPDKRATAELRAMLDPAKPRR